MKTARDKKLNESREIVSAEMVKKIFDNIKLEYVEMLGISHPKDFCLEVFLSFLHVVDLTKFKMEI